MIEVVVVVDDHFALIMLTKEVFDDDDECDCIDSKLHCTRTICLCVVYHCFPTDRQLPGWRPRGITTGFSSNFSSKQTILCRARRARFADSVASE